MPRLRSSSIFDPSLEAQSPEFLQRHHTRKLLDIVAHAYRHAPKVRALMDGVGMTPEKVRAVEDLASLPIVRKDELAALQALDLPFGGLLAVGKEQLQRIFMSPGNIYDPQAQGQDFWRFRPALVAAGFRAGDVVQNTFSYHLTPAGFMFDSALRAMSCVVVPAGVGQTELQVRIAHDVGVTGYVGTPSFLHTLLTKAKDTKLALAIEVAFVTGEMLPPSLRTELEEQFGIRVLQGYGTADLGMLAYECPEKNGMHLHPDCIVEILDLESGKRCAPGQPGEVVATIFDPAYPLIRFATGDLSSYSAPEPCACGRTLPKISGILGRVGDAVKVKGMFVRGSQIDEVMRQFPEIARYQAIVEREGHQDKLSYLIELSAPADSAALTAQLADKLRDLVKVRGEVQVVASGSIAQGAKRIDDRRVWR